MAKDDNISWRLWGLLALGGLALYWVWSELNPQPLVSDLAWQQYDDAATKALDNQ